MRNSPAGQLPAELADLSHLRRLVLTGNDVGIVPEAVAARWDAGKLDLRPLSLLHSVLEITLTDESPAVVCTGRRLTLRADGNVTDNTCRPPQPCIKREGRTREFDRLGRFVEKVGLAPDLFLILTRIMDGGSTRVSVRHKDGSVASVEYQHTSLQQWALEMTIRGSLERVKWTKYSRGSCVEW